MTSPHTDRINLVIQYALLRAGEEDDYVNRSLGPIHLIKYVYLADLAFAQRHGETYTGAPWRFYNFGPWTELVYEQIQPAAKNINADIKQFPSDYGKEDWMRISIRNGELLKKIENALPLDVTHSLRREIHKFGSDTYSLLDFVYASPPMRRAAPNEMLDFSPANQPQVTANDLIEDQLRLDTISNKKRKRLAERIRNIHEAHSKTKQAETPLINPVSNMRYDDVYDEGMRWLDSLAGPEIPEGEMTAEFSHEVWKSTTRNGDDLA